MSATTEKTRRLASWQLRKGLYGIAFLVLAILGYFGILSEIQADQILEQIDKWLPVLLGVGGLGTAFFRTGPDSDGKKPGPDLDAAADLFYQRMLQATASYGRHASGETEEKKVTSVGDYYAAKGE